MLITAYMYTIITSLCTLYVI